MSSWGPELRQRREDLGIKAMDLAAQAGISKSYLSYVERAITEPKRRIKKILTDALDEMQLDQLWQGWDEVTVAADPDPALAKAHADYAHLKEANRVTMEEMRAAYEKRGAINPRLNPPEPKEAAKPMTRLEEFELMIKDIIQENERAATLNSLVARAHKNAITKGWHEEKRSFGDYMALIHSEVSEALEDYRNNHGVQEIYYEGKKPCGIPIELADVLIRIFDLCGLYNIDLEYAVAAKMEYNKSRPHRHGGKVI